jgi:hypothetical protein
VDTDEKKQECFLNGPNDGHAYALEARDFENFQAMVKKAIVLENCRAILERKHKLECLGQQSSNSRPCFDSSSGGPIFLPYAIEFLADASTNWTRIFHPATSDDFVSQQLSDSEQWESECANDLS